MEPGAIGTGKTTPGATGAGETISGATATQTGAEEQTSADSEEKTPEEFGTANIPYTTSRVDLTTAHNESKSYPYSAAGVLYRVLNSTTAEYCSASLVKRGVIVTAGHCVANFGKSQFYSGWVFWPGASQSGPTYTFPFGQWKVSKAWVLTSYYNGTDPCEEAGVVCQDDVAVLAITPQSGKLPGTATGWFGYGVNGWGFTSTNITQITQLGYPISHDNGQLMQRTDSQGFVSSSMSNNTIWGSRQTGGSSGGPVVVNFGVAATLSGGTTFGTDSTFNQLVGVTSWDTDAIKEQGASPFTSANVAYLVGQACTAYPANCK
jgi:V8-like Glu-specific endopeptidase